MSLSVGQEVVTSAEGPRASGGEVLGTEEVKLGAPAALLGIRR